VNQGVEAEAEVEDGGEERMMVLTVDCCKM
jgi:hypothetical protein